MQALQVTSEVVCGRQLFQCDHNPIDSSTGQQVNNICLSCSHFGETVPILEMGLHHENPGRCSISRHTLY
jgi:hypothetical protein